MNNILWVIGSIWRDDGGAWVPGVTATLAPKDYDRNAIVESFVQFQKRKTSAAGVLAGVLCLPDVQVD